MFEQPFDLRIMLDFFWIWFYLRYFMRTQDNQIGDFSPEFAFHTFFPEKLKKPVMALSEVSYALFNMCGFVNFMHRYMQGLPTSNEASEAIAKHEAGATEMSSSSPSKQAASPSKPKSSFEPQPFARGDSSEKQKKALEFLDDEIKNFSKK